MAAAYQEAYARLREAVAAALAERPEAAAPLWHHVELADAFLEGAWLVAKCEEGCP